MKAIILAAGRGSRMGALTEGSPKCLTRLHDHPLLEWQIASLRAAGITEIAAVSGYRSELLEPFGIRLFNNPRWAETQMVVSLTCAAEWLRAEDCLVSYSDIFYPAKAARLLVNSNAPIAITFDTNWQSLWQSRFNDPLSDAETFRINASGDLLEIGGKPRSLSEVEGQYMGLLRFSPAGWASVEKHLEKFGAKGFDRLDMTSLLAQLLANDVAVKAHGFSGRWGEVDNESDLRIYEKMFSTGVMTLSDFSLFEDK